MEALDLFKEKFVMQGSIAITVWSNYLQNQCISAIFKMRKDLWHYCFPPISPFPFFPYSLLPPSKLWSCSSAAFCSHCCFMKTRVAPLVNISAGNLCDNIGYSEINVLWPANSRIAVLSVSQSISTFHSAFRTWFVWLLCMTNTSLVIFDM